MTNSQKSQKADVLVHKAPTVGKKRHRQGAQILRNEAYVAVRRSDEECSVTQHMDYLRDRQIMKGDSMAYSDEALVAKIRDMYPEVSQHGISVGLDFSSEKNAYLVKFSKGKHDLTTHLEKKDADDCMNNIKCVYLGVQVGQFLKNFEEAE